jgi:hypothetical protein
MFENFKNLTRVGSLRQKFQVESFEICFVDICYQFLCSIFFVVPQCYGYSGGDMNFVWRFYINQEFFIKTTVQANHFICSAKQTLSWVLRMPSYIPLAPPPLAPLATLLMERNNLVMPSEVRGHSNNT